jgi:hypothetical protein
MQDHRFGEDISAPALNMQRVVIASEAKQS